MPSQFRFDFTVIQLSWWIDAWIDQEYIIYITLVIWRLMLINVDEEQADQMRIY